MARISLEAHRQLTDYCDRTGTRMGTLLRELITAFLREERTTRKEWGDP